MLKINRDINQAKEAAIRASNQRESDPKTYDRCCKKLEILVPKHLKKDRREAVLHVKEFAEGRKVYYGEFLREEDCSKRYFAIAKRELSLLRKRGAPCPLKDADGKYFWPVNFSRTGKRFKIIEDGDDRDKTPIRWSDQIARQILQNAARNPDHPTSLEERKLQERWDAIQHSMFLDNICDGVSLGEAIPKAIELVAEKRQRSSTSFIWTEASGDSSDAAQRELNAGDVTLDPVNNPSVSNQKKYIIIGAVALLALTTLAGVGGYFAFKK